MGIILLMLLNLICIGLDIVIFFLVVRLILLWQSVSWLERFNNAGRTLVDAVAFQTGQLWYRTAQRRLSHKGELLISFTALSFARFLLCEIARFL